MDPEQAAQQRELSRTNRGFTSHILISKLLNDWQFAIPLGLLLEIQLLSREELSIFLFWATCGWQWRIRWSIRRRYDLHPKLLNCHLIRNTAQSDSPKGSAETDTRDALGGNVSQLLVSAPHPAGSTSGRPPARRGDSSPARYSTATFELVFRAEMRTQQPQTLADSQGGRNEFILVNC